MVARYRIICDNDYAGDPDGLFQLAHHLLSPSVDVRLVIASHLAAGDPFDPSGHSAAHGCQLALDVLDLLGRRDQVPVRPGSERPLTDRHTPQPSPASEAIITEAMRTDTDLPLFATFGGGLTELASAYLQEPRIAERLTAVWIGGPEYPDLATPPPGASHPEYNLAIDPIAARVVFDSPIPLWHVPRDCYRQALASIAELRAHVGSAGPLGAYLYRKLCDVPHLLGTDRLGETYVLGDNPLVLLTALQSAFQPDPSSSRYVVRPAPRINDDGSYTPRTDSRPIRVYTHVDVRLMLADLYAKLAAAANHPGGRFGGGQPHAPM